MRNLPYATVTFLFLISAVHGQELKIGGPAPLLHLSRTIPVGGPSSWESLEGKPVIIEFWATWCGYCIQEIPHLNSLARKFRDIQFISITDEDASVVEPFLAKTPIYGLVALDGSGATLKAYGIEGRPQTVLIDKDRVVRGIIYPSQLTEAVVNDFLAGKELSPVPQRRGLRILEDNTTEPFFATIVRPAVKFAKGGRLNVNPGYVQGEGMLLRRILGYAYSPTRLELPASHLLDTRYDFCVSLPRGRDDERLVLRDALERAFNIKVHREKKEVDALVLTARNPKIQKRESIAYTLDGFAGNLEVRLSRYVVNETGLSGYYDIAQPPPDQPIEQFVRELGFELSPARRTIEVLVLDSLQLPTLGVALPGR